MNAPALPNQIATLEGLPRAVAGLYDFVDVGHYELKRHAQHLAKLRAAMAEDRIFAGFKRQKSPPVFSLAEWTELLGAATPGERRILLGSVVAGVYKVSR